MQGAPSQQERAAGALELVGWPNGSLAAYALAVGARLVGGPISAAGARPPMSPFQAAPGTSKAVKCRTLCTATAGCLRIGPTTAMP